MPATKRQCREYRQRLKLRAIRAVTGSTAEHPKKVCGECGSKEKVEFAHVATTLLTGPGRGLTRRMIDVIRNPECYRLRCRRCHLNLDMPKLDEVPF